MRHFVAAVLLLCFGAHCVAAEEDTAGAFQWRHLGGFPYQGTIEQACDLHGLTDAQCARVEFMLDRNLCLPGDLQNGEEIDVTFTKSGRHEVRKGAVVAFDFPPNHSDRSTLECHLGDGLWWVVPTCNNYSLQRRPLTPSAAVGVEPQVPWQAPPRALIVVPGVTLQGPCCGCVRTQTTLPALIVPGADPSMTGRVYTFPRSNP
jgi:hypothetical protein